MSKNFFDVSSDTRSFPTTLLRDELIPALVGKDGNILYWAGKKIAREFVLTKDEEIAVFFKEAGWGNLERIKSKRNTQTFELSGPIIETRQKVDKSANYLLEAGFLAETIQNQIGHLAEALISSTKKNVVTIIVQVDLNSSTQQEDVEENNRINLLEEHDTRF
ncbi:MAG TPA: YslB family protein [Ligilactobacillus acidipiscis]|uniref:YslB family protein n=1 Tax=Ligilactobacillus acidipiscis TaxID=89059 RepID=A0A921F7J6_9LACO|nr:YslB family protein [Ligilactobacillus acidipiscis]